MLVAIASYGEKNIEFLKRIIARYQRMPFAVDVVVLSEAQKELGDGVEVLVGLPSENPWSLPFAHKQLFVDRVDRYDLFAYSEDDMEVTEENIRAFLLVTPDLGNDEIAGFLRYETGSSGTVSLPDVHGSFHWDPDSVRKRGPHTVAKFTNEHAAFFLLNQAQLKQAIASGGFLRAPCQGRYDMLCTAATDPYTNCGLQKVICLSKLEDFLIHHVPNRYAGHVGLTLTSFKLQIEVLTQISNNTHPVTTLCEAEPKVMQAMCSKGYYDKPSEEMLKLVPAETKKLLSIGSGYGDVENEFLQHGVAVTALPLDSVIGCVAAKPGIEMIYATLDEGIKRLKGRQFDAILITDLLHLLDSPGTILNNCAVLLRPGGVLVMEGLNFDYLPMLVRQIKGSGEYGKLRNYSESGIHPFGIGHLRRALRKTGLKLDRVVWRAQQDGVGTLSGAVAKRKGLGAMLFEAWRLFRKAGLALNGGRFLAQRWSCRAIKLS